MYSSYVIIHELITIYRLSLLEPLRLPPLTCLILTVHATSSEASSLQIRLGSGQLRNVRLCKSAKELISSTSAAHACSVFPYRTSTACIRTASSGLLSSRGRQPPRHKHQRQNPTVGRTAALRYCTVSALTPPEDLICPLTIFQRTAISGYVLQWKILPNQSNTHVQPTISQTRVARLRTAPNSRPCIL